MLGAVGLCISYSIHLKDLRFKVIMLQGYLGHFFISSLIIEDR